jgi:hypothetical protein
MDAGVVAGTLHPAPVPRVGEPFAHLLERAPAKCRPPFGLRRFTPFFSNLLFGISNKQ